MTQWGSDHNNESGDEQSQPAHDPWAAPPAQSAPQPPEGGESQPGSGQPESGQPGSGQPAEPWGPPPTGGQPASGQPGEPWGPPPTGGQQHGAGQPDQPQYGQPQYGQPQYGQPQYGQPQYGQPPYGQPQYGQPPYGQPPYGEYGQPQYGQGYPAAPGYNPYGDPSYGQAAGGWLDLPGLGTVKLASVGRRFVARLIDSLILSVVAIVLLTVGGSGVSTTTDPNTGQTTTTGVGGFVATILLLVLIGFLYEWLFISFKGQTLGKMAMGVRVVRADNGQIPGLGKGFVRQIIPAASSVVCSLLGLLMYISVFFDGTGRRQTWYDKAAGDFVISTK